MPLQTHLPVSFVHSHESRMFDQSTKVLAAGFGSDRDPVYLGRWRRTLSHLKMENSGQNPLFRLCR